MTKPLQQPHPQGLSCISAWGAATGDCLCPSPQASPHISQTLFCPGTSSSCLTSPNYFPSSFPREWILWERPGANSGFDRCLTWTDLKRVSWALSMRPAVCIVFKKGSSRTLPKTTEIGTLWPGTCHLIRTCRMSADLLSRKSKARPRVYRHNSGISAMREQSDGEI